MKSLILISLIFSFVNVAYSDEDSWQINSELSNMRAVMAFTPREDGSYCLIDVRGNSKLTPNFVKADGGNDPLSENNIPYCNKKEIEDFQKQAEISYIEGLHIKKTNPGSAAIMYGLSSMGIGCLFGTIVALGTDNEYFRSKSNFERQKLILDMVVGTITGIGMGITHSLLYLMSEVAGYSTSIAGGIAGALICDTGTTYFLSGNPKTDL